MSDRLNGVPTLEETMDDVRAVIAADSKGAFLCGMSEGGAIAAMFAATYPKRCTDSYSSTRRWETGCLRSSRPRSMSTSKNTGAPADQSMPARQASPQTNTFEHGAPEWNAWLPVRPPWRRSSRRTLPMTLVQCNPRFRLRPWCSTPFGTLWSA